MSERNKTRLLLLATGAVLLGATALASAESVATGTVRMDYVGCNPGRAAWVTVNGTCEGAFLTGQYNLQLDPAWDPDGNAEPGSGEGEDIYAAFEDENYTLGAFCADAYQEAPPGWTEYDVYRPSDAPVGGPNNPDGMGPTKAKHLRQLFHYVVLGNEVDLATPYEEANADHAAAIQAAVWEIVFETDSTYDVANGAGLRLAEYWGSGWLDIANEWLGWLDEPTWTDPDLGLRVLANESRQDYALAVPGLGAEPVPEPLTMFGIFAGTAAACAYVRRRRARTG